MKPFNLILVALCCAALIGFLLPLINISINIFHFSYSKEVNALNMLSFFNQSDSQFGGLDISKTNVFRLTENNEGLNQVAKKLIASIGSYFSALLLLSVILVSMLTGLLKKASTLLLLLSFGLYAYAGYTISELTSALFNDINKNIGFLNISGIIKIGLGGGYWLTIGAMACMLLIKAAGFVLNGANMGNRLRM